MISSTHRTHIRWPLFQRFLAIACVILLISLTIAVMLTVDPISVYLKNRIVSNNVPTFNVTYLLVDQSTNSLNLDLIGRVKIARSIVSPLNTSTSTEISTIVSPLNTSTSTEISILNETEVIGVTTCLKKLPITQESVEPYRINSTSTLFYQDDHSLIVVGASKFETLINLGTIKRTIIIDGIMVYKDCQRTFDISLPTVCHCSTWS